MQISGYIRTRISDEASDTFPRIRHTNPFPIDSPHTYAIYMSLLPGSISQAVKHLTLNGGLGFFDFEKRGLMTVELPGDQIDREIGFTFDKPRPAANNWQKDMKLRVDPGHPRYEEIVVWTLRTIEIRDEIRRCNQFIQYLCNKCNTPGQWNTVFPDFTSLLPKQVYAEIGKMKKKSPIPNGLDMERVRKDRDFVAEKLATALLLPKEDPAIWLHS